MNIAIPDLKTVTLGDISVACFDDFGTVTLRKFKGKF